MASRALASAPARARRSLVRSGFSLGGAGSHFNRSVRRPAVVARAIRSDSEQEPSERARVVDPVRYRRQHDEHVLHEILGGLIVSEQALRERADGRVILVVDDRNRVDIATPHTSEEGLLGRGQFRQGECGQGSPLTMVFPDPSEAFMRSEIGSKRWWKWPVRRRVSVLLART